MEEVVRTAVSCSYRVRPCHTFSNSWCSCLVCAGSSSPMMTNWSPMKTYTKGADKQDKGVFPTSDNAVTVNSRGKMGRAGGNSEVYASKLREEVSQRTEPERSNHATQTQPDSVVSPVLPISPQGVDIRFVPGHCADSQLGTPICKAFFVLTG